FSSLTPRPPPSALFPYTTLFRSGDRQVVAVLLVAGGLDPYAAVGRVQGDLRGGGLQALQVQGNVLPRAAVHLQGACAIEMGVDGDRKSTRLNSSHVKISYAVFCL